MKFGVWSQILWFSLDYDSDFMKNLSRRIFLKKSPIFSYWEYIWIKFRKFVGFSFEELMLNYKEISKEFCDLKIGLNIKFVVFKSGKNLWIWRRWEIKEGQRWKCFCCKRWYSFSWG